MSDKTCSSRQRGANWSERDRLLAVQLILEKEDVLYGIFKGADMRGARKKAWDEVTTAFNSQADEHRVTDQLKKCFENVRSVARKCLDNMKSHHAGRGPKPKRPKPSVRLVINKIGSNPNMCGLNGHLDVEATHDFPHCDEDEDSRWSGFSMVSTESVPDFELPVGENEDSNEQYSKQRDRKRTLEDTLLLCEIERTKLQAERAKLEAEKCKMEMKIMMDRRQEEKIIYELTIKGLMQKQEILDKQQKQQN